MSLPPTAALLLMGGIRSAFAMSAGIGVSVPAIALMLSFQLDLPSGPTCVALLALVGTAAFIARAGRS